MSRSPAAQAQARIIWVVMTPDDENLTVIACCAAEAMEVARDYCDDYCDVDPVALGYTADLDTPSIGLRWVGFESAADAENQARELVNSGVPETRIYARTTIWCGTPALYEVGARDADWCLLAAGVLCGDNT